METTPIAKVLENGILTSAGKLHKVDVIITATGYDTSYAPRFPIVGLNGVDLREKWIKDGAEAYLSLAVPDMPNYFSECAPEISGTFRLIVSSHNWSQCTH